MTATSAVLAILGIAAILLGPLNGKTRIWIANHVYGIGGPFELQTADGEPFGQDALLGHPHILYFGFTHCPDLCPTTLYQIALIMDDLGTDADRLKTIFVSVDPARDKPDILKEYISAFDPRMIALTGTEQQIRKAAETYRIFFRIVDLQDGDYTVDHSGSALLFSANGQLFETIAYDESDSRAAEKISRLLNEEPRRLRDGQRGINQMSMNIYKTLFFRCLIAVFRIAPVSI